MLKKATKAMAAVLAVVLLCPLLSLFASGAPSNTEEHRFFFNELEGESVTSNDDGSLTLLLEGEKEFSAVKPSPFGTGGTTNAVYVSLLNQTGVTLRLTLEYSCIDDADGHTVHFSFPSSGQAQSQWAYAPHIGTLKNDGSLKLTVSAVGELPGVAQLELYAMYDVSVYDPTEDAIASTVTAEIEQCYYEPGNGGEEGTIKISGSIPSIFEDDESTLAVFSFGPNDQDSSNVITKAPVARMSISKSFSFSIPARNAEEIYSRYAVAVVTKSGERRLLCQPIYPDIRAEGAADDGGFKGVHTDSVFSILDSGADVGIVDVYLDRLLLSSSDSRDSILYAGDHSYYFFSEAEIDALDHRVRNLTGHGCEVYLRFLVSPDAADLSYVNPADSAVGIVNKGVDIKSETALLEISALTDFLTHRYHDGAFGSIDGIILGRSADRSSRFSYVGMQTLATYAKKYATYLNLVAGTARSNVGDLRIVVPVSDRPHTPTVTLADLTGDYFSDLFIDSLLLAMKDLIHTPPEISIMLESYEGNEEKDLASMRSLREMTDLIERSSATANFLDRKILYAWCPSALYTAEELNAAYAIRYVSLFFNDSVRSFILDLSMHEQAKLVISRLKHLILAIDTERGEAMLREIQQAYPNQLLPFDSKALVTEYIHKISASLSGYTNGRVPIGSYALFDFSALGDSAGWYAGGFAQPPVLTDRSLTAQLQPTGSEEYAEIAYAFDGVQNYSVADMMRLSLGIKQSSANENMLYEVQIRLVGVNTTVVASGVIRPGDASELYLDLGGYTATLEQLRSIRILTRPLNREAGAYELYLNRVALESDVLSDAELAEQISARQEEMPQEQHPGEYKDYSGAIWITVILAGISLLLVAILIFHHLYVRKRNKT